LQHLGGAVHRNDFADVGSHEAAQLAGAAPEIANDCVAIDESKQRMQVKCTPKEVGAQLIPLPRGR
jgi:hypothetical protein